MKRVVPLFCLVVLSLSNLLSQQNDFPKLTGPYLGQKPPGNVPELFAPGIISFPDTKEFACGFSPDGKEFYYTSTGKESDYTSVGTTQRILYSKIEEGHWSKPCPAEFSKGFFAHEPHITFDNKRIFWYWANKNNPGVYYAERTQNGWSEAKYAGPGGFVSSSRDGSIYVGDTRGDSWSLVTMADGRFVKYEGLPDLIKELRPKFTRISHPCIAPDESYVVFDVEGGSHLFVSFKNKDDTWSEPVDLTEHGFFRKDGITSISPDGKYLFFQRNNDIYWVYAKLIDELKPDELK
ncbi:MAG: hypothetical protein A2V66_15945 [Ignavibacteria bacterium RBG_13_36_8]|nr:MAG: hypothetical protein A2V66_15945 [Ignavibacteria bacterium RBG_13_36_8]